MTKKYLCHKGFSFYLDLKNNIVDNAEGLFCILSISMYIFLHNIGP